MEINGKEKKPWGNPQGFFYARGKAKTFCRKQMGSESRKRQKGGSMEERYKEENSLEGNVTREDVEYMRHALSLAGKGRGWTNPNPMVGAVIVKNGRIIGEGYHERCGEGHAEVNAFRHCTEDPEGATLYVTLEPCSHYGKTPPCADLVVSKKVKRVVVAMKDPNPLVAGRGIQKIRDAGIRVDCGVLEEESRKLNEIFLHYIVKKDPFVLLKTAMTLDGKIRTVAGESQWISSEESRAHSQKLRNQYMSILVGVQTVVEDDPLLTCRVPGGKNPVRIIADSTLRIPESAKVLEDQEKAQTVIAIAEAADPEKQKRLEEKGVRILAVPGEDGKVDFKKLFQALGQEGIDSVLVEGGGTVAASVVESGFVDRVIAYIAPMMIGGKDAKTPVEGRGIARLSDALRLEHMDVLRFGEDVALTGRVVK